MPTLALKFAVVLEDFSIEPYSTSGGQRHHGPLFHRWLPDGERNSIALPTGDAQFSLQVWFDRTGFMENGRIRFDYDRMEIDSEAIPSQDLLDAGPLRGVIRMENPGEEVLFALRENIVGGPPYLNFGRRVYRLLHPPLKRVIDTLRANYGQYWINELPEWDPAEQSLGAYFSTIIQLKWSVDDEREWHDFTPDLPQAVLVPTDAAPEDYRQYLGAADWLELEKCVRGGHEPGLAAMTLVRTHRLIEENSLKQALVEGVTALEIAVNEFVQTRFKSNRYLADKLPFFWNLTLAEQVVALATTLYAPLPEIEGALKCVEMRNRLVRENWDPPQSARTELLSLLRTVGALLPGPRFRFPAYHTRGDGSGTSGR